MSPLLAALQTDFDTIWLNCSEEQIERVHIIYVYRDWLHWPGRVCM